MNEEDIVKMPVDPNAKEAVHIGVHGNDWYLQSQREERFNIKMGRELIRQQREKETMFL